MASAPKIRGITRALALLATGCATFAPTPYQPADGGRYGYRDERIGPNEYRITVAGNAATSPRTLWDYTLLRAAELAQQAEHDYFVLVPKLAGRPISIKPAFLMPQFGIGPGAGVGVRTPLVRYEGLPVGVEPSRELIATTTIALTQDRHEGARNVFDAAKIMNALKPKIFPSTR